MSDTQQPDYTNESIRLINKDFNLADTELADVNSLEELKKALARVVQYLIDHDLNRLINAMYRIDIPQHKFERVLTGEKPDLIASSLADLILEREKQKVLTRWRYRDAFS